jgi:outer membrane protein TolC
MKVVKRIGLLMMVIVLAVSLPVFAADPVGTPQGTGETISLEKCLELAMKNSKQLQQAAESVKIAQAGVQEASSGFYPSIGYQAGYQNNPNALPMYIPAGPTSLGSNIYSIPNWLEVPTDHGISASISLNQPLYTGGKLLNFLKLAQIKLASAREDERKAKQQLNYNVKEVYYRFWLAEKMLDVAQDAYDNMGRHYQKVSNLNKAGTASAFDLLQAKVQWDNQKPQLIKAKNGLVLARMNLATFIGVEQSQEFKVEYDPSKLQLPEKVDLTLQTWLDEAYQKRPELHQIQQLTEMAEANERIARAGYLPTVALSYKYSDQGMDFSSQWMSTWTLSFGLSGVIFDGFATQARVSAAKDNLNLARIRESSLKDQIRLETQQALQTLEENLETIRANQSNLELAKEALKQIQVRFTAGVATTSDITDSQLALEQTLNGYYQGVSSYLTGLAKLDLIAGRD